MNPLHQLIACGQSYWLDNLTRAMITSGELAARVCDHGLRGITSNPSTFQNAIAQGSGYDVSIAELIEEGLEVHDIYERLVVDDVRNACDILRPVYDQADGTDGFVSLEVSPYLAHDLTGSMAEALHLWRAVDRPNVMIKIPGTMAGVPAIEELLYEGVNINITLLFAIESYEAVAHAYMRALERRRAAGKSLSHIASVASFFLSRIDVLVDQLLGHRIQPAVTNPNRLRPEQLFGKVAIANAKLAYQSFKRMFSGDRWAALEAHGAQVQRLLWASTSTKDPLCRDVHYVEPLIGHHTVNTLSKATIAAFADHGVVVEDAVEADLEAALQTLNDLDRLGVPLDHVTWQLQNEGAQKFIAPYNASMQTLADKRQTILAEQISRQTFSLGELQEAVATTFEALDNRRFSRRMAAHDPYLWTPDSESAEAIRQQLGWLDCIAIFRDQVADLTRVAVEVKDAGFTSVAVLGMGSSRLCAEVCRDTFGSAPGWPELVVFSDTEPAAVRAAQAQPDFAKTLFIVASKSGTTPETLSLYHDFRDAYAAQETPDVDGHFIAITDPGTPLAEEAYKRGFRYCFENPSDVGEGYAALSYVGLLPMACIGVNIDTVLAHAHRMQLSCGVLIPTAANPGAALGALLGAAARSGRSKVTLVTAEPLRTFGTWVEQLLAEQADKSGQGLIPVVEEELEAPDGYGDDRLFVTMDYSDSQDAATMQRLAALQDAGHPVVRMTLPTPLHLGAEFFRWEFAIATASVVLGLNPFHEPKAPVTLSATEVEGD